MLGVIQGAPPLTLLSASPSGRYRRHGGCQRGDPAASEYRRPVSTRTVTVSATGLNNAGAIENVQGNNTWGAKYHHDG